MDRGRGGSHFEDWGLVAGGFGSDHRVTALLAHPTSLFKAPILQSIMPSHSTSGFPSDPSFNHPSSQTKMEHAELLAAI